jgi:hypothetical protein
MPPKKSSGRSPKSTRKSPRQKGTPASVPDVVPERLGDEDEEDDAGSEDGASVENDPHASVQALTKIREALSGLSQEEMQLLLKGVPAARPLQMDEKAAATASLDQAVRTYLWDALDDSTRKLYLSIESDPTAAQDGVWGRIFSGVRPITPELLPDISVYAHNPLLDWRPKKVTPDTLNAFRFRTKEATTDDVLYKIQDKPLSKLMRLVLPTFDMLSLPDLGQQFDKGLPKEIRAELTALQRLLRCFAMYTLALHSDIVQSRRLASLTALGMTKDEVLGTQFLLDAQDMQLMKDTVAHRKEKAVLAGVAGLRRPPIKKKPWKRNNRNGRGRGGSPGGEDSQSRDRGNKGDDDGNREDANKGSKDSSSQKSTSTPGKPYKGGKSRGKGK